MALGPLLGAAADRWSRKRILIAADVVRFGAFVGLALVGSFELTVLFALIAGTGQAAFQPAVMASLPTLVDRERLSAATLELLAARGDDVRAHLVTDLVPMADAPELYADLAARRRQVLQAVLTRES
jgi:hypothetical protein